MILRDREPKANAVGATTARAITLGRTLINTLAVILILFAVPLAGRADATGWLNPTDEAGDFGKPTNAFFDDNAVSDLDAGQTHQYWGFGISLPAGTIVQGIEVRIDAEKTTQDATEIQLEVSWDGGLNWSTTLQSTGPLTATMAAYIVGGPANTWGRTWILSDLGNSDFRVRPSVVSAGTGKVVKLDWLSVAITYEIQTLEMSTSSIEFGTLTVGDVDIGFKEIAPAQTLTVSSSSDWVIAIQAQTGWWTYIGPEIDPIKPCTDMEWRSASADPLVSYTNASYTSLSTSSTLIASGSAGTGIDVVLDTRMLVSYGSDPPGDYALEIVYVLTTP